MRRTYREYYEASDYRHFDRVERSCNGIDGMLTQQSAHQIADPPLKDLLIGLTVSGDTPARWKVGATWREIRSRSPGTIGISPRDEPIEFDVGARHGLLVLSFPANRVAATCARLPFDAQDALQQAHRRYWYDRRCEGLLRMLWTALGDTDPAGGLLCESLADACLISLATLAAGAARPASRGSEPVADLPALEEHLRAGMGTAPLDRAAMARAAGVPVEGLDDALRAATGMGPHAYAQTVRFDMALALLADPTLTIGEIATRLGFHDRSHFGKFIRTRAGCAPGQLRGG